MTQRSCLMMASSVLVDFQVGLWCEFKLGLLTDGGVESLQVTARRPNSKSAPPCEPRGTGSQAQ